MDFFSLGRASGTHVATPGALHLRQVVPEHPLRLWLTTDDGQARHVDFTRFIQANGGSRHLPWEWWRTVQPDHLRRHLVWPHGLVYSLDELLQEERAASRYSLIQVMRLNSADASYRPLLDNLPLPPTSTPLLEQEVLRRYGITAATLVRLSQHYAAPPKLLQRRLLDLALALGEAYAMTETGVRQLLHWQWHSPHRRTAALWPTPLAAIEVGDLAQVEATLYPHPPRMTWI